MAKSKYAPHAGDSREHALDWVGNDYPAGWCLKFVLREIYGLGGIGDWDGDGAADAEDYAKWCDRSGLLLRITDASEVPAGALLLWTGGRRDHGHAAYSLGDGEIVSTDLPKSGEVGRVSIHAPERSWGLRLAGYVLQTPAGYKLTKSTAKKPSKPKGTAYRVNSRSGLRGRTRPTTRSRTARIARYGETVTVDHLETVAGMAWAAEAGTGLYYAARYLTKV